MPDFIKISESWGSRSDVDEGFILHEGSTAVPKTLLTTDQSIQYNIPEDPNLHNNMFSRWTQLVAYNG
jgi:hypothetical protein